MDLPIADAPALPLPAELDAYEVEEHQANKPYSVGRPQGSLEASNEAESAGIGQKKPLPPFDEEVYWEAGQKGETDDEFKRKTGITHWQIDTNGLIYKYRLWVWTLEDYYYKFYDEEPDTYSLDVFSVAKWHYFDYNSNAPNIVRVKSKGRQAWN